MLVFYPHTQHCLNPIRFTRGRSSSSSLCWVRRKHLSLDTTEVRGRNYQSVPATKPVLVLSQHYCALTSRYTPPAQRFLGHEEQGQLVWVITDSRWDSKEWTGGHLVHLESESSCNENKVVSGRTNTRSCCCS